MSGFGPFKPRAVFPAGWYFKPIRSTINRSRVASNTRRFPAKRTGPRRPVVVQPVGWYFKPVRVYTVTVAVRTSRAINRTGCGSSWGGRI